MNSAADFILLFIITLEWFWYISGSISYFVFYPYILCSSKRGYITDLINEQGHNLCWIFLKWHVQCLWISYHLRFFFSGLTTIAFHICTSHCFVPVEPPMCGYISHLMNEQWHILCCIFLKWHIVSVNFISFLHCLAFLGPEHCISCMRTPLFYMYGTS